MWDKVQGECGMGIFHGQHLKQAVLCCRQTQQVQTKQADKDKALKERAETGKGPDITQGVANDNINKDTFK